MVPLCCEKHNTKAEQKQKLTPSTREKKCYFITKQNVAEITAKLSSHLKTTGGEVIA